MSCWKVGFDPPLRGILSIGLAIVLSGCYHARLITSGESLTASQNPPTEPLDASRVVPVPPLRTAGPPPADYSCPLNGLYQVRLSTTFGDALGAVFTFGAWSRVTAGWWCAKLKPQPVTLGPAPPSVAGTPPTGASAPIIRTTLTPRFWGALQDDLNPQVNTAKNPANCNSGSMRQVSVPKSYGHALITVLSLGIWAPITVEWQCGGDGSSKSSASVNGVSK